MPGGLHPPPSVIESWPTPNYVHPQVTDHTLTIMVIVVGAISIIIVSLRMLARFILQRNAGWDDYVMLAALVPTYGLAVCCCYATQKLEYDRHFWDVPLDMIVKQRKMNLAIQLQYVWGATLIKLSVLTFDRRLGIQNITPRFNWAVRVSIGLVLSYWLIWTILILCQCSPFEAYWFQFVPSWVATHKYSCLNEGANTLSNTIVSTVTDFIAFMLPSSLLIKLQISRKQKLAFLSVFAVGLLVCIVGIIRIYYITNLYYHTYDVTWVAYHVFGATAVELLLAVICASAPALKIYFQRCIGRNRSRSSAGGSSGRNKSKLQTIPVKNENLAIQLRRLSKAPEKDFFEIRKGSSGSEDFGQDIEDAGSFYPLTGEQTKFTPSIG